MLRDQLIQPKEKEVINSNYMFDKSYSFFNTSEINNNQSNNMKQTNYNIINSNKKQILISDKPIDYDFFVNSDTKTQIVNIPIETYNDDDYSITQARNIENEERNKKLIKKYEFEITQKTILFQKSLEFRENFKN